MPGMYRDNVLPIFGVLHWLKGCPGTTDLANVTDNPILGCARQATVLPAAKMTGCLRRHQFCTPFPMLGPPINPISSSTSVPQSPEVSRRTPV